MATLLVTDELWDLRARLAEAQAQARPALADEDRRESARGRAAMAAAEPATASVLDDELPALVGTSPAPPLPSPVGAATATTAAAASEPPQKRTLRRPLAPAQPSLAERIAEARDAGQPGDRKSGSG